MIMKRPTLHLLGFPLLYAYERDVGIKVRNSFVRDKSFHPDLPFPHRVFQIQHIQKEKKTKKNASRTALRQGAEPLDSEQ